MKATRYLHDYYAHLVRNYVLRQEERFLAMAADLGRAALRREVPLEEIAAMHDTVLLALAEERPDFTAASVVHLASPPFMEVLMAYGLAFRDQMEQRHAIEAQLLQARDAAEAASRAKSDFLASMSHELRTPLNAVIGFADIISSELFGPVGTERYREDARNIAEAGRHLLELISDILDVTKVGSGHMALDADEIDLVEIIETCVRMIHIRAEHAGLSLMTNVDAGVPRLLADRMRVKQMLLNLLSNAMKFTPPGGRISISAYEDETNEGIVIRITDTGIGMKAEDIPRALAPFVQLETGIARRYEGPGLGLALVKSLVELHEGTFTLTSTPGKGTQAEIRFPSSRAVRLSYCI
ncbi:MAG: PAS/PAC sensor Signal transduction histidine kinase [Rhodospirillaceae bacterium]|nr:MAG: PAS/PAC sensor Signal transduction histidine kinase [Rhodospirillaceae bacterium]